MVIDLCLMMLAVLIFWQTEGLSKFPEWIHRKNTQIILILYTIVTIVVIIVFVSIMANSVGGSFLKYALAALGLHFIALPLAMLLLQNIISLVVAIVALALLCLIIYIAIQFLLISGGSEGGETIAPASSSGMHRNVTSKSKKKDSAIVLEFLKDKKIDAFYCSPYKRSVDTIADAAAFFRKEIITDERLREREKGPDGNNHGMFQKRWADHDYHEEGGEPLAMVQERNIEVLNEILSENIDKGVVIGTHGTALSTILNWISRAISWLVSRSTAICLTDLA